MDNGRGESTGTNGILLEDEIMVTSPVTQQQQVAPQQQVPPQSQSPIQAQAMQQQVPPQSQSPIQAQAMQQQMPPQSQGSIQPQAMQQQPTVPRSIYEPQRVNVFLGVIGALIGTLLAEAGMIALDYFNLYSGVAAGALFYLAAYWYALLGGRLDKAGIVICILMTLPAVWIGHKAGWTMWYVKNLNAATGIKFSFTEFMNVIPDISNRLEQLDGTLSLKDSGKLMEEYYKDTFISITAYLVVMIWMVREFIIIHRKGH